MNNIGSAVTATVSFAGRYVKVIPRSAYTSAFNAGSAAAEYGRRSPRSSIIRRSLELWREERWGAVVLLAGLADDDGESLRATADGVADEWASRPVRRLLLDAAQLAEIGA